MKNKAKIILFSSLAITPIAIVAPIATISCSNNNSKKPSEPIAYENNFNLYLDPNKKEIVKPKINAGTASGFAAGTVSNGQMLSFVDENPASPTYQGWYLLLRDIKSNQIIASFCGWNDTVYEKYPENFNNKNYIIPPSISLPENVVIQGLGSRDIPVEAVGFSCFMPGFEDYQKEYSSGSVRDPYKSFVFVQLFQDFRNNPNRNPEIPCLFFPKILDLSNSKIKYFFEYCGLLSDHPNSKFQKPNSKIIFPESLVYIQKGHDYSPIYYDGRDLIDKINSQYTTITLDLSKTSLSSFCDDGAVKLKNVDVHIILPPSCKSYNGGIYGYDLILNKTQTITINLENVLEFGPEALRWWSFPNNTITINKNAKYVEDAQNPNKNSFPPDVKIIKV